MKLNTTYQENRRESIAVNGNHFPNKSLCELDAIPKFAVSVNRWMPYIRSVNEAHVVMLYEQGILKLQEAGAILKAIEELDYEVIGVNSAKAANYVPNMCKLDVVYDTVENLINMISE